MRNPLRQAGLQESSPLSAHELTWRPAQALTLAAFVSWPLVLTWPGVWGWVWSVAQTVALLATTVWPLYRSRYVGDKAIADAWRGVFLLLLLATGALTLFALDKVALAVDWRVLLVGVWIATCLGMWWLSQRQCQALAQAGVDGPWPRQHLLADRRTLRASAFETPKDGLPVAVPMIAAASANLFLVIKGAASLPVWVFAGVTTLIAWLIPRYLAPLAGQGLFLIKLERATGAAIRHEHDEALDLVRQRHPVARCLRPRGHAPAAPASTPRERG